MLPVCLAFSVLPCPHPPNPLPNGKGEIFCFLMQGASPLASPGAEPGRHRLTLRSRYPAEACPAGRRLTPPLWCPQGACLPCRPPTLPLVYFPAPYPPQPPSPVGKGEIFLFSYARGSAPCIPATEPGRHWLNFKKPILFGVAGERRLQSIKIREKFLGVWGLLSRSPQALPRPLHPRGLNPGGTGSTLRNRFSLVSPENAGCSQ